MVDAVSQYSFSLSQTDAAAPLTVLLDAGNIEAAIALVLSSRIEVQNKGLGVQLLGMQSRNGKIGSLNKDLASLQEQYGRLEGAEGQDAAKASIQKQMTEVKGEIDSLNSDSQIETIGFQSQMQKLQQTIDQWSNAVAKIAKTTDTIIGNTR